MSTVVLFDDERSFIPGFRDDAIVIRSIVEAEEMLPTFTVIDELWLDFVLSPGCTTEALHALKGVTVKKIIFHSSAFQARSLVVEWLKIYGIDTEVELPTDRSVLIG